jgi:hypothetical protein
VATYIAVVYATREWAALPGDFRDASAWGPALAHELSKGFWRGRRMELVSSDDPLYAELMVDRDGDRRWRDRTAELEDRARRIDHAGRDWSGIAMDVAALAAVLEATEKGK